MRNNSKILTGLIIGAAAGAVIALMLNSKQGKKVLEDLKDMASKGLSNWQQTAAGIVEKAGKMSDV